MTIYVGRLFNGYDVLVLGVGLMMCSKLQNGKILWNTIYFLMPARCLLQSSEHKYQEIIYRSYWKELSKYFLFFIFDRYIVFIVDRYSLSLMKIYLILVIQLNSVWRVLHYVLRHQCNWRSHYIVKYVIYLNRKWKYWNRIETIFIAPQLFLSNYIFCIFVGSLTSLKKKHLDKYLLMNNQFLCECSSFQERWWLFCLVSVATDWNLRFQVNLEQLIRFSMSGSVYRSSEIN